MPVLGERFNDTLAGGVSHQAMAKTEQALGVSAAWGRSDRNDERDSLMTPPLDSRQLRAFATLARTASFTQTARELHLTQSAISHSMKALESDVGVLRLPSDLRRR